MITLLTGDNSFEIARTLDEIVRSFDGVSEKVDGSELELDRLPDLLQGGMLFANDRLVIIRELSENKKIWEVLPDWLKRVSDEVHLVLVESKPDKRTKTFKELQKQADVKMFTAWGERDVFVAEKWVIQEAKRQNVSIDKRHIRLLIERTGMDQWALFHALEKLAVLDKATPELIEQTIAANPTENVFNLFDAALQGNAKKVQEMIRILERTEDPYKTFGLLSGQAVQLAAMALTSKKSAEVAGDIGAHPFVMSKLAPHAKRLGKAKVSIIVRDFADTDNAMKSTGIDPWLLIEKSLIKTASI